MAVAILNQSVAEEIRMPGRYARNVDRSTGRVPIRTLRLLAIHPISCRPTAFAGSATAKPMENQM